MTLFMPVSVTSVECLCFRIGDSLYNIPLFNLNKLFTAQEAVGLLSDYEGSVFFDYDKRQVPVLDMHCLLGCGGEAAFYIVCHSLDDEFVIGVDDVLGDYSCASKSLPSCLDAAWQERYPIRNVAIMDDGTVSFVLNAVLLAEYAQGRKQMPPPVGEHDENARTSLPKPDAEGDVPSCAFVFTLGSEWHALPAERVERLVSMPACTLTPGRLPYLMGLTNYRNHAIAVLDLAGSAGAQGDCPYVLIVEDDRGENVGLTISSAVGIRHLDDAVLADEQPEPRVFADGWHTATAIRADLKEPTITLLAHA